MGLAISSGMFRFSARYHFLMIFSVLFGFALELPARPPSPVIWSSPSEGSAGSMPIGNGEIGLNVWAEANGMVRFYVAKSDAWDGAGRLLRLGGVDITFSPNPFEGGEFSQTLDAARGQIVFKGADGFTARLWVDANAPVIRIQAAAPSGVSVSAKPNIWRREKMEINIKDLRGYSWYMGGLDATQGIFSAPTPVFSYPDTIADLDGERIGWYQRNETSFWEFGYVHQQIGQPPAGEPDPLLHRTFGLAMGSPQLLKNGPEHLESAAPLKEFRIDIVALTAITAQASEWVDQAMALQKKAEEADSKSAFEDHSAWWKTFWGRSYIHVTKAVEPVVPVAPPAGKKARNRPAINPPGAADGRSFAERINEAYQLQRYMSAIAGRGAFPIHFNGSLFWGEKQDVRGAPVIDPDWRQWAGDYWWQNTRLPYYPMLASGDFEMMKPLFEMYFNRLPAETARTKAWFGCEGAFVGETATFWGMMSNGDYGYERPPELKVGETKNPVMRYYWQPGIELIHMMLDYYDHTGDKAFVKDRLAPMAEAYLKYYSTRFSRDAQGKLVITPAQSLETWANVVNPTPDVAGLAQNTRRILALPNDLVPDSLRKLARELHDATPAIPMRTENGRELIGFAGQVNCKRSNRENPELYTVYPYRTYGIRRPGLELARETYSARTTKDLFGWHQSGMQAACLGLADECARALALNLRNQNPKFRFPVMWGPNYDWLPDQCHGANFINTLQLMLLQTDGEKILIAPAWSDGWDVEFKLHAPGHTIVEAAIRNGKIEDLKVTPTERKKQTINIMTEDSDDMRNQNAERKESIDKSVDE